MRRLHFAGVRALASAKLGTWPSRHLIILALTAVALSIQIHERREKSREDVMHEFLGVSVLRAAITVARLCHKSVTRRVRTDHSKLPAGNQLQVHEIELSDKSSPHSNADYRSTAGNDMVWSSLLTTSQFGAAS